MKYASKYTLYALMIETRAADMRTCTISVTKSNLLDRLASRDNLIDTIIIAAKPGPPDYFVPDRHSCTWTSVRASSQVTASTTARVSPSSDLTEIAASPVVHEKR